MESQNKIYQQFKAAAEAEEHASFPNQDKLWANIEAKLDKENKNKNIFFIPLKYIAAAIVIFIGIGLLWKANNSTNKQQENQIVTSEKSEININQSDIRKDSITNTPNEQAPLEGDKLYAKNKSTLSTKKSNSKSKSSKPLTIDSSNEPSFVINKKNGNHDVSNKQSETRIIHGSVKDSEGELIQGASVAVKGTDIKVATDENGQFSLEIPEGESILVIDAFGNDTKEQKIFTNINDYSIDVVSKGVAYNEEIKIYGQRIDKRSYVGAINRISNEQISKRPITTVGAALDGATPGLLVTNGGGQPGNNPDIMLRGQGSLSSNSAPLVVVDGAPYAGALSTINPLDIKDLVVLKDATSKAVYGARAANGVILITTKSGSEDSKKLGESNLFDKIFGSKKSRSEKALKTKQAQIANDLQIQKEQVKDIITSTETYEAFEENSFASPKNQPLSTFSIDVDRASYSNIRRFVTQGQMVPKDAVRIEEMINYFNYNYPKPKNHKPFELNTELTESPWNPQHQLLRIGMQALTIPKQNLPASNLVFLIDVSGSMADDNKLPLLKKALTLLVQEMREQDKVSIVVYAGAAGLVLPSTSGANKKAIINALDKLEAGGSTAGGQGIELAYKIAKEQFIENGNNRVILATDGDFNVGSSSDGDMQRLIEQKRNDNIFLTCLGFGMGNYKDSKMEILANKGNGNYAYIDNETEAEKILQKEFGGTLYTIAKDVKIQIEFNPNLVQAYRLIGYENRILAAEDFANDAVDAGELGSGHSVTALYEIIPQGLNSSYLPKTESLKYTSTDAKSNTFNNEIAQLKYRYKLPTETKSKEFVQTVSASIVPLEEMSAASKLAITVAWFGLKLRDSKLIQNKESNNIKEFGKSAIDNKDKEQVELLDLINKLP